MWLEVAGPINVCNAAAFSKSHNPSQVGAGAKLQRLLVNVIWFVSVDASARQGVKQVGQ
jgi:hypothetical protein